MGSSSGSCEPTAGRLEGVSTSGRDGVRCDFCVWRSFSSVSFNFFCTSCNSRRAWVSCLVGLISFNLETTAWIKGDIKPEGSSDLLGMGASGSVVRWRCSDKVSMSTPWSRIAFSNCAPNTLSAILLVVMIPKNRPSERSLSPNSDAPWRVSNPMGTVSGFRPHMFFLLLQAVGWMVFMKLMTIQQLIIIHRGGGFPLRWGTNLRRWNFLWLPCLRLCPCFVALIPLLVVPTPVLRVPWVRPFFWHDGKCLTKGGINGGKDLGPRIKMVLTNRKTVKL